MGCISVWHYIFYIWYLTHECWIGLKFHSNYKIHTHHGHHSYVGYQAYFSPTSSPWKLKMKLFDSNFLEILNLQKSLSTQFLKITPPWNHLRDHLWYALSLSLSLYECYTSYTRHIRIDLGQLNQKFTATQLEKRLQISTFYMHCFKSVCDQIREWTWYFRFT